MKQRILALITAAAATVAVAAISPAPAAAAVTHFWNHFVFVHSGKLVGLSPATYEGQPVAQYKITTSTSFQWEYVSDGSGSYALKNRKDARCMDLENGSTAAGTRIVAATCDGTLSQRWFFIDNGTGGASSTLMNSLSGLVMDVAAASTANGAQLIVWPFIGGANQKFVNHFVESTTT